MNPRRGKGTFVQSSAGVSKRAALELVPELDEHLASLAMLHHQYLKHLWLTQDRAPERLGASMQRCQEAVVRSMNALAGRTLLLGGVPIGHPIDQANLSYLEPEGEGIYALYDMVRLDLEHERALSLRLRITIETARELDDAGTEAVLKGVLGGSEVRARGLAGRLNAMSEGADDGMTG